MTDAPTFGIVEPGAVYTPRRAAYAVIATEEGSVAAVKGREKYFLPGGGALPEETPEDTVLREVREELGCGVRLVGRIGEAVQYFYAATDACHYEMRAVFFAAEWTEAPSPFAEHELFWLPVADAEHAFFHASHAWAARSARAGRGESRRQSMSTDTGAGTSVACSIMPMLSVRKGARAVEFYQAAFGAIEVYRVEDPSGAVVARLSVAGAEFWLSDESPEHGNFSPESLGGGSVRMILTVPDPDAVFANALAAGAQEVVPVEEAHGWRLGRVLDPFGHHWEIGCPVDGPGP